MATRTLQSSPQILPLYARAAAPLIPGASLLPGIPGGGKEIPELELQLPGVHAKADDVAAYARVCGFPLRDSLPVTYPHVLAFPLHMAVMADGSFPFGAVGLVHVENKIVQHRPIGVAEELHLLVRPTPLQPHRSGRTFSLVTEVRVGGLVAWESVSTMLRRGGGDKEAGGEREALGVPEDEFNASAEWRLGGDLGRRYAGVSGDRNPIHMHSLTAKPLGFPAAIAHGMWSKARALAALDGRLPDGFETTVQFRKPILLPAKVEFASRDGAADEIDFSVRDAKRHTPHLDGRVRPLESKPEATNKATTKAKKTGRKAK
jgi:acyl dehydratase